MSLNTNSRSPSYTDKGKLLNSAIVKCGMQLKKALPVYNSLRSIGQVGDLVLLHATNQTPNSTTILH